MHDIKRWYQHSIQSDIVSVKEFSNLIFGKVDKTVRKVDNTCFRMFREPNMHLTNFHSMFYEKTTYIIF
jgi:hypothetical protein